MKIHIQRKSNPPRRLRGQKGNTMTEQEIRDFAKRAKNNEMLLQATEWVLRHRKELGEDLSFKAVEIMIERSMEINRR